MKTPRQTSSRVRRGRGRVARLCAVGAGLTAAIAGGSAARAEDKAGAVALFREAGALVDAGQPSRACPKYEESLRLYDSVNTRYFLADCYERIGKMASAWAHFLEVAARVHTSGDRAKEAKARDRAAAVQPKVSRLTVVVEAASTPGLAVKRDGTPVGPGQWGVPMPVDAGTHVIEASAPGKRTWTAQVEVEPGGATSTLVVRPLEDDPASSDAGGTGNGRRTLALVTGGAGIVAVGVGTALAFGAKSTFDESRPFCNGDRCDQRGMDLRDSAVARANVATVVFGVGLAAIAGGGVLWLTAKSPTQGASIGLAPTVGGALVRGSF
ncbi:hypothetical protein SOCE26_065060 [Sorangium cellulosum]|uniref:PEGA domain-containing protein n=1 Tax=Sorangium cellulosum TaxID=56 RepID=A0A2L0F0F1_SORCE|nr:hypothetical protein [Sorangium cellulosum]AUX45025.1 hypothetical protein SOCE26_065060 [Sorangium cellulosum]